MKNRDHFGIRETSNDFPLLDIMPFLFGTHRSFLQVLHFILNWEFFFFITFFHNINVKFTFEGIIASKEFTFHISDK